MVVVTIASAANRLPHQIPAYFLTLQKCFPLVPTMLVRMREICLPRFALYAAFFVSSIIDFTCKMGAF